MHINWKIQNTVTYYVLEHKFTFQRLLTSKKSRRKLIFLCRICLFFKYLQTSGDCYLFVFCEKEREIFIFDSVFCG